MERIIQHFNLLKSSHTSGKTLSELWRKEQLEKFLAMMVDNQNDIFDAIRLDIGKSNVELYLTEVGVIIQQIEYLLKNLHSFLQPINVRTPMMQRPSVAYKIYQPKGVILIACPSEYPINYLLVPLAGAIAAGNCVFLYSYGMDEMKNFNKLLSSLMLKYLDDHCIFLMNQAVEETFSVYDHPWDQILYIGHPEIGKKVNSIASNYATPVDSLLDVKCPVIVDQSCEVSVSAKRIMWGKFLSAGQNCSSPDYVLIHRSIEDHFLSECKKILLEFYGVDPSLSPSYSRISNDYHFKRLLGLLNECGKIVVGGTYKENERYFSPTLVTEVNVDAAIMKEVIMGPILPIIPYDTIEQAVQFVREQPRPSVLYLFANDKLIQDKVLLNTVSGNCVINDVLVHLGVEELPYGGVGESGNSLFNGRYTFKTFSHCKSVMHKATWMDPRLRYPPYEYDTKLQMSQLLM